MTEKIVDCELRLKTITKIITFTHVLCVQVYRMLTVGTCTNKLTNEKYNFCTQFKYRVE